MLMSFKKNPSNTEKPSAKIIVFVVVGLGALGAYFVSTIFGVLLGVLTWFWLRARSKYKSSAKAIKARQADVLEKELPDIADLFAVAVSSGLTVRLALEAVVEGIEADIWPESKHVLSRVLISVRLGEPLADALNSLPDTFSSLAIPLIESERYGTELLPALQNVSNEVRVSNRRKSEIAARRIPVKLLFPLVICILPAFGLLTLVPVFIRSLQAITLL